MKKITAKIREALAKRKSWRRVDRKTDARLDEELYPALHEAQKDRAKLEVKIVKLKDKDGDFFDKRRHDLAEKVDEVESYIDRILLRIDDQEKRQDKAERLKAFYGDRVKELKKKREKIKNSKGDLTEHFSMAEFNCHAGGPVPEYMRPHLKDLCERVLEPMRKKFGACHVNSGHRWSWYNVQIGGASLSYHVYENRKSQPASDLTFATGSPSEWAAYARSLGVGGVGQYPSFVHVDTGPRRDWWG